MPRKGARHFKKVTLRRLSDSLQSVNNPNKSPVMYNKKGNTNPIIFKSFISKEQHLISLELMKILWQRFRFSEPEYCEIMNSVLDVCMNIRR